MKRFVCFFVVLVDLAFLLLDDRRDDDVVRAEELHLREDLLLGAVADREHRDHRRDAEQDAERRQARAQLVVRHRLGRDPALKTTCASSARARTAGRARSIGIAVMAQPFGFDAAAAGRSRRRCRLRRAGGLRRQRHALRRVAAGAGAASA